MDAFLTFLASLVECCSCSKPELDVIVTIYTCEGDGTHVLGGGKNMRRSMKQVYIMRLLSCDACTSSNPCSGTSASEISKIVVSRML